MSMSTSTWQPWTRVCAYGRYFGVVVSPNAAKAGEEADGRVPGDVDWHRRGVVCVRLDSPLCGHRLWTVAPDKLAADGVCAVEAPVERYPRNPVPGEETFAAGERVIDREWGPGVVVTEAEYTANALAEYTANAKNALPPGYTDRSVPVRFDNVVEALGRRYATTHGSDLTREAPLAQSAPAPAPAPESVPVHACAWGDSCPHGNERARGWELLANPPLHHRTHTDRVAPVQRERVPVPLDVRPALRYRPVREPRRYRALVGYDGEV